MSKVDENKVLFREVLRAPIWLGAFIYFMLASLVLAIWAALDNRATVISAVAALFIGLTAILALRREIRVDLSELRVGNAHIERKYLGAIEILDRENFLLARTRNADPAAYFALTFWVSKGVKVDLNDPRDPTPYWLISTRNADELKRALES